MVEALVVKAFQAFLVLLMDHMAEEQELVLVVAWELVSMGNSTSHSSLVHILEGMVQHNNVVQGKG